MVIEKKIDRISTTQFIVEEAMEQIFLLKQVQKQGLNKNFDNSSKLIANYLQLLFDLVTYD